MNVLYCTSKEYAPFCGVSMASLFYHNTNVKDIHVYIAANNIGEEEEKLKSIAERFNRRITFLDASKYNDVCKEKHLALCKGGYSTYHRFLALGELECDRVLCLDCDTIIQKDLSGLYDVAMGTFPIGAVMDCIDVRANYFINNSKCDKYFNAGVILYQLDEWKRQNCEDAVFNALNSVGTWMSSICCDQNILNYVFGRNFYPLPIKYNEMWLTRFLPARQIYFLLGRSGKNYYSKTEITEGAKNPAVIHFASGKGECCPWYINNSCPEADRQKWLEYLKLTPWRENEVVKELEMPKKILKYDRNVFVKKLPWTFSVLKKIKTTVFWNKQLAQKRRKGY